MKRRQLIATLAAGAALASQTPSPARSLTFNAAVEIARDEIVRRGLAATHHVSALYAGADRQSEGAAFAVIVRPHASAKPVARRMAQPPRLKLLIHEDGHTTLQTIPPRSRARV